MDKEKNLEAVEQNSPTPESTEKTRFQKFLNRLTIFHSTSRLPVRTWLAWLGIILFIALVIAYYATNGG